MSAIDRARTLANMAERAKRLLSDGYVITPMVANEPNARGYFVDRPRHIIQPGEPSGYIVFLHPSSENCTCEAYSGWRACKHIYACQLWEEEQAMAEAIAQYEADQAAALFEDDYAILSDRAEREIREAGFDPF